MGIVYPNGSKEVEVSQSIAIFTTGTAQVYYKQRTGNIPPIAYYSSTVSNEEVVLTPGSDVSSVIIYAGPEQVLYEVGASPTISIKFPDDILASTSPITVSGEAGTDGSGTTAGGAGGGITLTSGIGGQKSGTGTANGGAAGAISITGASGGATAASASSTGGAGADITLTAGNGGAASAGTSNGGAGGSVYSTPGTGGASAGGTAGVDGMLIDRGIRSVKQGNVTAKTVSATLTAAEVKAGIITVNQAAGATSAQQLPLASAMDTAFPDFAAGDAFDFSVINTSVVDAEDASITTNTGWTLVGSMDIHAYSDAGSLNSSGRFRARKTGSAAWTLYRLS